MFSELGAQTILMCLPSDPVSGKVGEEAQNFPEAAIPDVAEVEKVFPRLIFFSLCRTAPTLLARRGMSAQWVLSFEERLWCPSCILEEPNPKFGT